MSAGAVGRGLQGDGGEQRQDHTGILLEPRGHLLSLGGVGSTRVSSVSRIFLLSGVCAAAAT